MLILDEKLEKKAILQLALGTRIRAIELDQSCHTKFYPCFRHCRQWSGWPKMWGIPNAGTWQKIGRNERLGVPSTKWLLLTPERFPHHTRPTFTRSTLLRGQVPHTARNKRSAVACHFLPAIFALFGKNFTRKCTDFWGYRVD